MKTLPISSDIDLTTIPHIDRRTDGVNLYLIEIEADYASLPEDMYAAYLAEQESKAKLGM